MAVGCSKSYVDPGNIALPAPSDQSRWEWEDADLFPVYKIGIIYSYPAKDEYKVTDAKQN